MKKFSHKSLKALAFSASALAFVVAGPANAQDAGSDDVAEEDEEELMNYCKCAARAYNGLECMTEHSV